MRASPLLLLGLLAALPSMAGEAGPPTLELLEYLGEWQDTDGNEIDPQALALLGLEGASAGEGKDEQE